MNKQIYAYAMVKVLYNEGHDYLDSFWPFVLESLPEDKSYEGINEIKQWIIDNYGLDIPLHSLRSIITRAKRNNYIKQKEHSCALSDKGKAYFDEYKIRKAKNDRRIRDLVLHVRDFLNREQDKKAFSDIETEALIHAFINEHTDVFEDYIFPSEERNVNKLVNLEDHDIPIRRCFIQIEHEIPGLFDTLRDVIFGSIISSATHGDFLAEATKKFEDTEVYIDTNFLFYILELDYDERNRCATELVRIMRKNGNFKFMVFDFSIEEASRLLKSYISQQHLFIPNIRVSSIFSSLKSKGWTAADVTEYIVSIEDKIRGKGISIIKTGIKLKDYSVSSDLLSKLNKYKPGQTYLGQIHDLAALDRITKIRRGGVRRIENAGTFFLTSDFNLCKYNYHEMGHKEMHTISEAIPDRILTNVIWLKNPSIEEDLDLSSVLTLHSETFIDTKVWFKFRDTLEGLKKEGALSAGDASILFWDGQFRSALEKLKTPIMERDWVEEEIREAKERWEERNRKIQESEELDRLRKEQEKLLLDTKDFLEPEDSIEEEKFVTSIKKTKDQLQDEARGKAKILYISSMLLFSVMYISLLTLTLWYISPRWESLQAPFGIIAFFIGVPLAYLPARKYKDRYRGWLEICYTKRVIKNSILDEMVNNYFSAKD